MSFQLVFIVGSGRSGTTLLRNILEMRPEVGVTPELRFFDLVLASRKKYDLEDQKERENFIKRIFKRIGKSGDPQWKGISLDYSKLEAKLRVCRSFREIFLTLVEYFSSKPDPKILIEKTPANVFFLEQILEFFPEAKIIHIIRDGREVVASAQKRGWAKNTINLMAWWKEAIKSFDKIQNKFPEKKDDFLEIKYEDLVTEPKNILNQTFSFLELKSVSQDFFEKLEELPAFSSFFEEYKTGFYESRHFDKYFSLVERKKTEFLLRSALKKKGYSVKQTRFHPFSYFEFLLHILKLKINLWFRRKGIIWIHHRFKRIISLN